MDYTILVINPGSTSTKIALYKNEEELFNESVVHPQEEIEKFGSLIQEIPMRQKHVLEALERNGYKPKDLSIVMGRGGLFPPIKAGGYKVNQTMMDLVLEEKISPHASNLGSILADGIAKEAGVSAYIYDAESSDELTEIAKITGMKEIVRRSFCHVLNSKAVSRWYAESKSKKYEEISLIVAHLGGGISLSAHQNGKIIDSLSDDNGPFAPERSGGVPLLDLIDLCYSGDYSKKDMQRKVRGLGGMRDLLGTSDGREIARRMEAGDKKAMLVMEALGYQVAKGIALLAPALKGKFDAIILTGGLANNKFLVDKIKEYIDWLGPIEILPGEHEMTALALGGLRIIRDNEPVNEM
ncbi:MAG: butyrate kinase [Defluviitaleaceae bacterium]|nr:butyrate kinase [Defluviitaleaceae bacterium]